MSQVCQWTPLSSKKACINLVIQRALISRQCHHPEPCIHSFFLGHLKATLLVRWAQASTICQYPTKPSLFICCIYTFGNSILLSMVSLLLFGIFLMDFVKYLQVTVNSHQLRDVFCCQDVFCFASSEFCFKFAHATGKLVYSPEHKKSRPLLPGFFGNAMIDPTAQIILCGHFLSNQWPALSWRLDLPRLEPMLYTTRHYHPLEKLKNRLQPSRW